MRSSVLGTPVSIRHGVVIEGGGQLTLSTVEYFGVRISLGPSDMW